MECQRTFTAALSAVIILSTANLAHARDDPLNIDWAPAPLPQNGPPFDRKASRNRAMIPMQVGAIVGAYLVTILFIAICYMTFGRRLRRAAQASGDTLEVEMVKPAISKGSSPASPENKKNLWPSPLSNTPPNFSYPSPTKSTFSKTTVVDFNEQVIEADKEARQREMERLYAAAYEYDDKNKSAVSVNFRTSPSHTPSQSIDSITANSRPYAPPNYLQRAPSYHSAVQTAPPARSQNTSPSSVVRSPPANKLSHSRKNSVTSLASTSSKRKAGVRGLQISNPIPTPTHSLFSHQSHRSDEEPLTPRYPPPPTPPGNAPAPTPSPKPASHLPSSPRPTGIDEALHSHRPTPPPPNASIGHLPLRSPTGASVRSHNTRQTEVAIPDRRRPGPAGVGILPGNGTFVPMSAALSPTTPYSAYQPQTPLTPFTPRLVTRAERKAREKEEGRGVVKEVVPEEKDMWE